MCLIIYESRYGSTLDYVTQLESTLNATLVSFKKLKQSMIDAHSVIVVAGSVYIDSIHVMKVFKKFNLQNKRIVCIGVGIAEPTDMYVETMKQKVLTDHNFDCDAFYMLRGRLNVNTLKWRHRFMLKTVASMLSKKTEPLTDKEKGIVDIVNNPKDELDLSTLNPIIEKIQSYTKKTS